MTKPPGDANATASPAPIHASTIPSGHSTPLPFAARITVLQAAGSNNSDHGNNIPGSHAALCTAISTGTDGCAAEHQIPPAIVTAEIATASHEINARKRIRASR